MDNETLSQQIEALEEALRLKDKFLSCVSHELRTPLNGISGMVQLLNMTRLDDEQQEYLQVLKSATNKMNRLINNLIHYTLLNNQADVRTRYRRVLLKDVFRQLLETQKTELADKQLTVEISISPLVDGEIVVDLFSLETALDQLIDNAIKFSRECQIFINASVDDETGKQLQIEVIDEGIGFDTKLFDSGQLAFEAEDYMNKALDGLGLGLPIVKKICGQSGFNCQIQSKRGFGTKAVLICPYCYDEENPELRARGTSNLHARKALVVDDDENGRVLLSLLCKKLGMEVEVASGGKMAVELGKQQHYDLIYMDIQMPEISGLDALKRLRENGQNRDVPILAVTAYALKGDEERFLASGFDGYIAKPVAFHHFEEVTRKALQMHY